MKFFNNQVSPKKDRGKMKDSTKEYVKRMLTGDRAALARLITRVENRVPEVPEIMEAIYPSLGSGASIGITGPPGAGKSTLVSCLIAKIRSENKSVGVIAVDPSSPFSGGAVLGDRIRMQEHALDDGVFIRSVGSRGSRGGISRTTGEVVHLLDACGFDWIIVETVGVGQTELDIMEVADTTVVVLVPESGDTIQTMKAGLMEIADIFAVNKSDREGADQIFSELTSMVSLYPSLRTKEWTVPVLQIQANKNVGIDDLLGRVEEHRSVIFRDEAIQSRREEYQKARFFEILSGEFHARIASILQRDEELADYLRRVLSEDLNPYSAALELMRHHRLWELIEETEKKPRS